MAANVCSNLQTYLSSLESRLSLIESKLQLAPTSTSVSAPMPSPASSATLDAYDSYFQQVFPPFQTAATTLGADTIAMSAIVEKAFLAQRRVLEIASQCQQPAMDQVTPLLQPLQEAIQAMNAKQDNRSDWNHHYKMLSEGIQGVGWFFDTTPKAYIESFVGGSDFWGNKIRVQFKGKNDAQIKFVATFKTMLTELMNYVKAHYPAGLTWNSQGQDLATYLSNTPATTTSKPSPPSGGMSSVFAGIKGIDQSQGKTAGLRTVTKDMQTWRSEYKGEKSSVVKSKKPKATEEKPLKPPVCEQRQGNWMIEYQGGPNTSPLTVNEITLKQQVYIYGCINAVIILQGKAKSIVLDNCKSTKLIFDDAVSSVEIVNCKKVQVQCKGKVPSVAIDKTDGCLVYLSYTGKDAQLVTSKSSEMNVSFPTGPEAEADYVEIPIPEQFVHKLTPDLKLSSAVSDLYA